MHLHGLRVDFIYSFGVQYKRIYVGDRLTGKEVSVTKFQVGGKVHSISSGSSQLPAQTNAGSEQGAKQSRTMTHAQGTIRCEPHNTESGFRFGVRDLRSACLSVTSRFFYLFHTISLNAAVAHIFLAVNCCRLLLSPPILTEHAVKDRDGDSVEGDPTRYRKRLWSRN